MARAPRRPRSPESASGAAAEPAPAPRSRPARGLGPARRGGQGRSFTSKPVSIAFAGPDHRLDRADLEIEGVFHGEASYEGRVFLNNPNADASTPRTVENGYAGSFYVFGHGGCLGDPGHCEVGDEPDRFDFRPPHPLTPTKQRVTVTKALREIARTSDEATVTVVPVITAANELCNVEEVFRFQDGGMRFVSYDP